MPSTLTDPVLRLAEYWLSARLMHDHVHEMREEFGDVMGVEQAGFSVEFLTYLTFWLSALYVVCEGFLELKFSDPRIEPLIAEHVDSLRIYRNATFHFQRKPDKHAQFHDGTGQRLNWAEDLHAALEDYFRQHLQNLESVHGSGSPTEGKP